MTWPKCALIILLLLLFVVHLLSSVLIDNCYITFYLNSHAFLSTSFVNNDIKIFNDDEEEEDDGEDDETVILELVFAFTLWFTFMSFWVVDGKCALNETNMVTGSVYRCEST